MQLSAITKRDVRITRQLAFLALASAGFYIILDAVAGAYEYVSFYFILVFGALLALFFIRREKTGVAKASLLISANLVVAGFSSVETVETGIFFYFILLSIGSLTLYGYRNLVSAFAFAGVSVALFLFVFLTDIKFIPEVELTPEYIRLSLIVNFMIMMVIAIIIVYYLLQNNYLSEKALNNERKSLINTTRELESSKRRFELAIQGSSAAIWDWDISNDFLFVTPKLAEIVGRPLNDIQGTSKSEFLKVLHPDDIKHVLKHIDQHFTDGEPFETEFRLRTGNGKYVWVLGSGKAEFDKKGVPVRMVGTIIDIHEKKLAIEQVKEQNEMLAKANQELDRFVYSTSHDLRAPLSSLLGLINIAERSNVKEDRDEMIKMMRRQIIKLDSYIQDITDYSRNTRVEVEKEEFSLYELVEEAIQNHKFMEGADTIEIIYDIEHDLKILSDKSRFKIIINNLISNAIKYQDPDREERSYLRIHLEKMTHYMIIAFEDNGTGIDEAHQAKIFDMFFRASDRSRGSGLGLYIAKEIALKINCNLRVNSELGKGSVFKVIIPQENVTLG